MQQELNLKEDPGQTLESLDHKSVDSSLSMLVRSDSGEENWTKVRIKIKLFYVHGA